MDSQPAVVARFAELGLPVYGLPGSDPRVRWIAEYSTAPVLLVLAHGASGAHDRLDVGHMRRTHPLRDPPPARLGETRVEILPTLADRLFLGRHEPPDGPASVVKKWVTDPCASADAAAWAEAELTVAGASVPGFQLDDGGHWIVLAEVDRIWLYVHSRGGDPLESVEVERVVDPSRYLAEVAPS